MSDFKNPLSYEDFHNHFGGVLPVDALIQIYNVNFRKTDTSLKNECKELHVKLEGGLPTELRFQSTSSLAVRLAYHILKKYAEPPKKKDNQGVFQFKYHIFDYAPERGAHAAMFALVFLTLVAIDAEGADGIPEMNWSDVKKNLIEKEDGDASFTETIIHRCYGAIIAGALKNQKIDDLSRSALHKMLKATKISPFDDAYVARNALIKMFDKGESIFAEQSFDFLKQENINYCEMSQPSDKLPEFDPKEKINLRWLALIASHRSYLAGKNDDKVFQIDLEAAIKKMGEYAPRIVGIDLAGPEGYAYGKNTTEELVRNVLTKLKKYVLNQEVQKKGVKQVVFRPHVGEGSSLLDVGCTLIEKSPREFLKRLLRSVQALKEQGEQFNGKHIRRILNEIDAGCVGVWKGERSKEATERAQKNLEAFLTAIEANEKQWLKDKILIRFGHATHTTLEQAKRMEKLGIYADINMGSNLRTGAIAYIEDLEFTSANTELEIRRC